MLNSNFKFTALKFNSFRLKWESVFRLKTLRTDKRGFLSMHNTAVIYIEPLNLHYTNRSKLNWDNQLNYIRASKNLEIVTVSHHQRADIFRT